MLKELSEKLQKKEISPVELLNSYLEKIDASDSKVNAFLEVEREQALEAARAAEERITAGNALSEYDGLPVGIKDNIVTKGRKTQCASKILEGFESPYSATVIHKLHDKGIVTLGRLNMDEFAMGSSTENSAYNVTKNPHDLERAPGGSSGGSAAAVAAGMLPVALGSDTGGSIRQPAAFCGITGLKPTYGTVSRYGLVAFASSLDQIGPLSADAEDSRIIYDLIKGYDRLDSTTIPESDYKPVEPGPEKLRIGVIPSLIKDCDDAVKESYEKTLAFLQKAYPGSEVVDLEMAYQKYAIPVYYITATSEASANLARFDGVRYGRRADDVDNLNDLYEKSRSEGFGPEVKRRILLGTYALSSGYYDAFYGKAQKVRSLIRQDYLDAFTKVDVIMLPSTPTAAFKIGDKVDDPVSMYLSDVLTVGASLAGVPALSVPGPSASLPVGMQLQGPFFSENRLFSIAEKIEAEFKQQPASL